MDDFGWCAKANSSDAKLKNDIKFCISSALKNVILASKLDKPVPGLKSFVLKTGQVGQVV